LENKISGSEGGKTREKKEIGNRDSMVEAQRGLTKLKSDLQQKLH